MTTLFVTQLDFGVTESDLLELFQQYGVVANVSVIKDKLTARSRGFAFVDMNNDAHAQRAIQELNGYQFNGRACIVKEASKEKEAPPKRQETQVQGVTRSFTEKNPLTKKKTPKKIDSTADGKNKKTKMNAHKKSGKNNQFFEEEDDLFDVDIFGVNNQDDTIEEEDYRNYILNSDEEE